MTMEIEPNSTIKPSISCPKVWQGSFREPASLPNFNIHKHALLVLYVIYVCLTGCVYIGWAPLSTLLSKANIFASACAKTENGEYIEDLRPDRDYICNEQDAQIQKLYTIAFAFHCTFSTIAGITIDYCGPLLTAVIGQLFNIMGWIALSYGLSSDIIVYVGIALIGAGADMGFLPSLCITRLYPGNTGLIITILGSAASCSFIVPRILELIAFGTGPMDTLYPVGTNPLYVCALYALIGPGISMVIALLFIPFKGFRTNMPTAQKKNVEEQGICTSCSLIPPQSLFTTVQVEQEVTRQDYVDIALDDSDKKSCDKQDIKGDKTDIVSNEKGTLENKKAVQYTFFQQLFSTRYIIMTAYFIGVGWISSFYQQSPGRLFSSSVVDVMKALLPFSFVGCIILGKLADIFNILYIMYIVNICGLFMYVFALYGSIDACAYISVVLFTIYMSLFTSQAFVYIEENFSYKHFGKLIGIIQMIGGLSSLLSNILYEYIVFHGSSGINAGIYIMIGIEILQFFWVTVLVYIRKKYPSPFVQCLAIEQTPISV